LIVLVFWLVKEKKRYKRKKEKLNVLLQKMGGNDGVREERVESAKAR